jgi:hypothetical protein
MRRRRKGLPSNFSNVWSTTISQRRHIVWDGRRRFRSMRQEPGAGPPKVKAMAFLQAALAGGPVPAAEVNRMARQH